MTSTSHFFGTLPDGRIATRYSLSHSDGIEVQVTNYGATLLSIIVPDPFGKRTNVILAYDSLEKYQRQTSYGGGIVGRFANRIRHGQFAINGNPCQVTVNTPPHHLHGGTAGFDRRLWQPISISEDSVTLEYVSRDGEEGYPGTLTTQATYTLTDPYTLRLDLIATSDQPTIANLTAHPYFNLAGEGDILNHLLTIPATHFTPVDETLIPTGEFQSVADTPFDFRTPTAIGAQINIDDQQLRYGTGYDHNFVLKTTAGTDLVLAAHLNDPVSGRVLNIYTTHPGVQLYSGNYLSNNPSGANGRQFFPRCAVAIEPQGFPDAPNHPHFPSPLVTPEKPYRETIVYQFNR